MMYGSSGFSSVIAITERSEMISYDVHMFSCLCLGLELVLLFLLCFIATWTCVVVSVRLGVCSLSVFLSLCLFVLCF